MMTNNNKPVKPTTTATTTLILRLEDYAAFQYMVATPSVASAVVDQMESFVFYNEPHDPLKKDHVVMVQGTTGVASYYGCCMCTLPSHMLGMSQWISSEDYYDKDSNSRSSTTPKILRRFRYSYYFGLLQVDARHMQLLKEGGEDAKDGGFVLVEYMDISPWAWVIAEVFLMAFIAACMWSLQRLAVLFSGTSIVDDHQSSPFSWTTFVTALVASNASWLLFRFHYRP